MARNLAFTGNNWLTLVGLGCILGGLYTRHEVAMTASRLWIGRLST